MYVRNENNFLRPGELSCKRPIYSRVDIRNSTRNKLSLSLIQMCKTYRALIHVQTELRPRWAGLMQMKHVHLVKHIYIYSRFVSSRRSLRNLWCLLEQAVTVSVSLIEPIKLWGRIKEIYCICLLEWAFKTGFSCEPPSSMSSVGLTRLDSSLKNYNHKENTHNGSHICPGLRRLPPKVSKIFCCMFVV